MTPTNVSQDAADSVGKQPKTTDNDSEPRIVTKNLGLRTPVRRVGGLSDPAGLRRYPQTMSSAQEWELTVPADGEQLMDELRKHGVAPGQRLRVTARETLSPHATDGAKPAIFDLFDGPPDLSERADEILEAEFPGE